MKEKSAEFWVTLSRRRVKARVLQENTAKFDLFERVDFIQWNYDRTSLRASSFDLAPFLKLSMPKQKLSQLNRWVGNGSPSLLSRTRSRVTFLSISISSSFETTARERIYINVQLTDTQRKHLWASTLLFDLSVLQKRVHVLYLERAMYPIEIYSVTILTVVQRNLDIGRVNSLK